MLRSDPRQEIRPTNNAGHSRADRQCPPVKDRRDRETAPLAARRQRKGNN